MRQVIRIRRMRDQFFPPEIFAGPAWDMLLDLMAARLSGANVSVSKPVYRIGSPCNHRAALDSHDDRCRAVSSAMPIPMTGGAYISAFPTRPQRA
ncbi:hypothetical protein DMP17_00040 [Pseudonocardia sp. TMWB2A]